MMILAKKLIDEAHIKPYNRYRKGVAGNGQPQWLRDLKNRLTLEAEGGFSYALIQRINVISKTKNAKKSNCVIRIAPFRG